MFHNIIEFRSPPGKVAWEAVEEALNDRKLIFSAGSLSDIGFEPLTEITSAVERAMAICSRNGVSVNQHFKTVYISDQDAHTIRKDWKLSKLAYTLVMINGAWDNPMVGQLQLEILEKYLKQISTDSNGQDWHQ